MADDKTVVTDDTKTTAPVEGKTVLDDVKTDTTKVDDTKTDTKADDTKSTKTDDGDKGTPAVPEKYELKIPKDSLVDESELEGFAEEAKSLKLSQEAAQKLLESRSADRARFITASKEKLAETVQNWRESLNKDVEIAGKDGSEFEPNIGRAKLALEKFGTPELRKALNETGYGNHPEVVRLLVRIGKALKEDSFHTDGRHQSGESGDPTEKRAQKFYGKTQTT